MKAPDRIDVAQSALSRVLSHPLTWAPFAPIAGAFAFIGTPWWMCLPAALLTALGIAFGWARRWPVLALRTRTDLLLAFRQTENKSLEARIAAINARPAASPLVRASLREAMEIKRAVDNRVFADGTVTVHEEEVSQMVADLVRRMADEAEAAAAAPAAQLPKRAAERFENAAATLHQAFAEIDLILDPVPEGLRAQGENHALDRASERLSERLEQARGIRRLMEKTVLPDALGTPETNPAPEAEKQ